jgi:uncharacterized membrane protein YagU involved in acid resistance
MKIVRSFSVSVSKTVVRECSVTCLTQAGYRQQPDSNGYLHFRRGSKIGALFNFNPQRWACDVHIHIKSEESSSEINMEAEISTDPTEKRFAEELVSAEFSLLETAISMNEFKTYDVSALKKKIAAHFYRVVGIFASFIFSVILGIVSGLFAYIKLNLSVFGASAIVAGVLLLMAAIFLILWRKQKKTDL